MNASVDPSDSWEIERLLKTHGIDFRLSAGMSMAGL
jgi:hypothetical protein